MWYAPQKEKNRTKFVGEKKNILGHGLIQNMTASEQYNINNNMPKTFACTEKKKINKSKDIIFYTHTHPLSQSARATSNS